MAAIWFLLFDNCKAIMSLRSRGVSIPEQGMHRCFRPSERMMEKRGALAMLKKRYCNTSIKRIASVVTKASRLKLVVATATVIGILLVAVHVFDVHFLSVPPQPAGDVRSEAEPLHHIDGGEPSLLGVEPVLGRLMTQTGQRVSSLPGGILVGRRSDEGDAPDLSTPSVAVYSVLALIDRDATETIPSMLCQWRRRDRERPVSTLPWPSYRISGGGRRGQRGQGHLECYGSHGVLPERQKLVPRRIHNPCGPINSRGWPLEAFEAP